MTLVFSLLGRVKKFPKNQSQKEKKLLLSYDVPL